MLITLEYLQDLPVGRVLKRWVIHGRHEKLRIIRPVKVKTCDTCNEWLKGTAARAERSGNMALGTYCLYCTVDDLNKKAL